MYDTARVGPIPRKPDVPEDVTKQGREDAEISEKRGLGRGRIDDRVDRRAAGERNEPDDADEARCRREGEQVVAPRERLQDHVVERERERRADER